MTKRTLYQIWYVDQTVCIPLVRMLWSLDLYRDDVRSLDLARLKRTADWLRFRATSDVTYKIRPVESK